VTNLQAASLVAPILVSRLRLRSPTRKSLRDAEGHSDTFGTIANVGLDVAVYTEEEAVPSEPDTRTETNGSLLRIRDILAIDLMVRQSLQHFDSRPEQRSCTSSFGIHSSVPELAALVTHLQRERRDRSPP
jgi:hypothetical protein